MMTEISLQQGVNVKHTPEVTVVVNEDPYSMTLYDMIVEIQSKHGHDCRDILREARRLKNLSKLLDTKIDDLIEKFGVDIIKDLYNSIPVRLSIESQILYANLCLKLKHLETESLKSVKKFIGILRKGN